jgi:hypothetical protein
VRTPGAQFNFTKGSESAGAGLPALAIYRSGMSGLLSVIGRIARPSLEPKPQGRLPSLRWIARPD